MNARHSRRFLRAARRAQRRATWTAAGAAVAAAGLALPNRMTRDDRRAFFSGYAARRDGAR